MDDMLLRMIRLEMVGLAVTEIRDVGSSPLVDESDDPVVDESGLVIKGR